MALKDFKVNDIVNFGNTYNYIIIYIGNNQVAVKNIDSGITYDATSSIPYMRLIKKPNSRKTISWL